MRNFGADLEEACIRAAKDLRDKHKEWNTGRKESDKNYSGEREFVAEVYRLLIDKDEDYWNYIFVDYLRPEKKGSDEQAVPDLVYRDKSGDKAVVEVKVLVSKRKRISGGSRPLKQDHDHILADYKQFKNPDHYKEFDKKFQVAAFLGDTNYDDGRIFSMEEYKKTILEDFPNTGGIKVIPC